QDQDVDPQGRGVVLVEAGDRLGAVRGGVRRDEPPVDDEGADPAGGQERPRPETQLQQTRVLLEALHPAPLPSQPSLSYKSTPITNENARWTPTPASPEGATRKRRRRGELRGELVAAARDVFVERGYHGASLRQIAIRANATQADLYRHFP